MNRSGDDITLSQSNEDDTKEMILGKMSSIKERHVNMIVDNEYLYADAPLPVLRHIWVTHPHKFHQELEKVMTRFQSNWHDALLDALTVAVTASSSSTADLLPLLYWPPRRRRRDSAIVRIVEMIGDGETLYNKTMHILREQCRQAEEASVPVQAPSLTGPEAMTGSSLPPKLQAPPAKRRRHKAHHSDAGEEAPISSATDKDNLPNLASPGPTGGVTTYSISPMFLPNQAAITSATLCTLRFDLLMSLNEAKVDRICVRDRVHQLVWCLDACVRNRRIDQRHASGLAYHLQLQRQRYARETVESEDSGDEKGQAEVDVPDKHSRSGQKLKRSSSETSGSGKKISPKNLLEYDIHMACRDPWVVYTICTSLIRYTLNGLYEDKLPRDIPEVSLLVQLLLQGLGNDLDHDEETRVWGQQPAAASSALVGHILPAVASLQTSVWRTQVAEEVLATAGNLWSSPLGSVAGTSSSVTGSSGSGSASATVAGQRRVSLSESKDTRSDLLGHVPSVWRKPVTEADQATGITLPADYLSHPIGLLMLQYHALFALERNELAVLRCLLKTTASIVQHQHNRVGHKQSSRSATAATAHAKQQTTLSPTFPGMGSAPHGLSNSSMLFRWRPEVLQALVLGIARLPTSAPAFVDTARSSYRSGGLDTTSALTDSGVHLTDGTSLPDKSNLDCGPTSTMVASQKDAGPKSDSITASSDQHHHRTSVSSASVAMVTRAELASLLRGSLTLLSDLQLLALAQIALLVPSSTPPTATASASASGTTAGTAGVPGDSHPHVELASPAPPMASASGLLSERERLVNVLARHCVCPTAADSTRNLASVETLSASASTTASTVYRSSNPKVLQTLDYLRKEVLDRGSLHTNHSLPLTSSKALGPSGGLHSAYCPTPGPSTGGVFRLPSHPDCWTGGLTPRSPTSTPKYFSRSLATGSYRDGSYQQSMSSPANPPRLNFKSPHPLGTSAQSSGYGHMPVMSPYAAHLPIGTPLTNPGLMGATPNLGNLNVGHGNSFATPRRVPSPPSADHTSM